MLLTCVRFSRFCTTYYGTDPELFERKRIGKASRRDPNDFDKRVHGIESNLEKVMER